MNLTYGILFLLLQWYSFINPSASDLSGSAVLNIAHTFGDQNFELDQTYSTFNGDKVTVTRFKYYVSNIELIKKDGSVWTEPNSYHLIEVSDETSSAFQIKFDSIPTGSYTQISFAIGVDSVNNHNGKQEGMLDPDHGMFWMWETGYVFFKVEGYYQSSSGNKGAMVYHVGRENCYRKIVLNVPVNQLKISHNLTSQLYVTADVKKTFGGFAGALINLKAPSDESSISVMGGDKAIKVASNFAQIFSLGKK